MSPLFSVRAWVAFSLDTLACCMTSIMSSSLNDGTSRCFSSISDATTWKMVLSLPFISMTCKDSTIFQVVASDIEEKQREEDGAVLALHFDDLRLYKVE